MHSSTKEIINFYYMINLAKPCHKTLCHGTLEFTILVGPSLFLITIIYTHFVCTMPGSREDLLKKYINTCITLSAQKLCSLGEGMKYTCLLALQILHTKFGKDWLSTSCEEDGTCNAP